MGTSTRVGAFAQADRRLARSVGGGLVLLGAVALLGPLISYRSDSRELHATFQARIARETQLYASALQLSLGTLEAELVRLAQRPEIDLRDNTLVPERELLDFTHHNSALFTGVAILSTDGTPLWSEPKELLPPRPQGSTAWFQRMLHSRAPSVGGLQDTGRLVIAVPVLREGQLTGAVVGLLDPVQQLLPGGQPVSEHLELALLNADGRVIVPSPRPAWASLPRLGQEVEALIRQGGGSLPLGAKIRYANAVRLDRTGLTLLLIADERAMLAPMRAPVLLQLLTIVLLQLGTFALFTLSLRASYGTFRRMEEHATEHERLAALGAAASLIAHEVKNSLNGLKAAVSLLSSGAQPELPTRSLRGQIDRLSHLARSLLQFGRPSAVQRVPLRLDQLVPETVESLRDLPELEDVQVETAVEGTIEVQGDPLLLMTALDNLLRNAIEAGAGAMDLGRIETPWVRIRADHQGPDARVQIEDNGGGPPPELMARLFQPFVTSKAKGIGLGLMMARRAVEQQGGTLQFERTPEGSRFTIRLPAEELPDGPVHPAGG